MQDIYGFDVCKGDFVLISYGGLLTHARVNYVNNSHIIVDIIDEDGELKPEFVSTFAKITSDSVYEKLKELFWRIEGRTKPWETKIG